MSAPSRLQPNETALHLEIESIRDQLAHLIAEEKTLFHQVLPYLEELCRSWLATVEQGAQRLKSPEQAFPDQDTAKRLCGQLRNSGKRTENPYSTLSRRCAQHFRRLIRAIHPTVQGREVEVFKKLWPEISQAYRDFDLETLGKLEAKYGLDSTAALPSTSAHAPATNSETPTLDESSAQGIEVLKSERKRLYLALEEQIARIIRLRETPPLCHEQTLNTLMRRQT